MIIGAVGMATSKVAMEMVVFKMDAEGDYHHSWSWIYTHSYYKSTELLYESGSLVHEALLGLF